MSKIKEWVLSFKFMNDQRYAILMYLVMGGITTLINIVSFWLCNSLLGINYSVATIIAWVFSVMFAYVSNKMYVFESKNTSGAVLIREVLSFVGFRILSLLMDLLVMYICVSLLKVHPLIAKILANVVVLIANYVFSKVFIFKK